MVSVLSKMMFYQLGFEITSVELERIMKKWLEVVPYWGSHVPKLLGVTSFKMNCRQN